MTSPNPREWFPEFYSNPAINALGSASRWTISGRIGEDNEAEGLKARKAPIDVRHLVSGCNSGCQHAGPLRGAWALDERCLLTLNQLVLQVPNAANAAYHLQSSSDGLAVIDIEPGCPEDIAHQLLQLPGILYSETSMSGNGYHLVVQKPKNLHDFPIAAKKTVLQHEKKWFEILFEHWITFTRNPIPDEVLQAAAQTPVKPEFATVESFYAELAQHAKVSSASAIDVDTSVEFPEIPSADAIIYTTLNSNSLYLKTIDDFDGDASRYEFSVLGSLYRQMLYPLMARINSGQTYSASDRAWLLYKAALEVLPERPKHRERRNGRPFLLDRAAAMVASNDQPSAEH